ncbi:hypothetical protein GCM10009733_007540 [Nonomuraea maheshkhaliensis]|uniref:HTH cro/C1-type domain-containing protein n=2 Tax=Nonomuraea maheshkhaliensis TaxID=419590 RepID=A0ABP4QMZ2_9ACTN
MNQIWGAAEESSAEEVWVRNDKVPNSYIQDGQWPTAQLDESAPIGAFYAQEIARRLRVLMNDQGLKERHVAERAGLSQKTVNRMLLGDSYCDIATLARLEAGLETDLYPTGMYRGPRQS